MKNGIGRLLLASFLIGIFAFLLVGSNSNHQSTKIGVYIDPVLYEANSELVDVIVTGSSAELTQKILIAHNATIRKSLPIINAVSATVSKSSLDLLISSSEIYTIIENKRISTANDLISPPIQLNSDSRAPLVSALEPTTNPKIWSLTDPTTEQIGANQLHDSGITGENITVAVVDSGIYFDQTQLNDFGTHIDQHFLGQADFVGYGQCAATTSNHTQYADHCFTDQFASIDPYGHGSHVAGIIWNNYTNATTNTPMGIAPDANILSVRALGEFGWGYYEDVIEAIQYVIDNKDTYNIRVLNLSISGFASTPYFVDPLNRAVETAWSEGIVVVSAAGNLGSNSESVTVPGNDPYIITAGSVDTNLTPDTTDDTIPQWASSGPTHDGFIKPDVVAPGSDIISFAYRNDTIPYLSSYLAQHHPQFSETTSFFRMDGTSMSAAITSGTVALMLQQNPSLTPDQVKYRLAYSARPAQDSSGNLTFNLFQQGAGRIWAPDAVQSTDIPLESANQNLDIEQELAHPWIPITFPDPSNDPDSDGDGIRDSKDLCTGTPLGLDTNSVGCFGAPSTAPKDSDGDGVPDHLDTDTDNDQLTDLSESGIASSQVNTLDQNNDGVIDPTHLVGYNGYANAVETETDSGRPNFTLTDTDKNGIPDFRSQANHFQGPTLRLITDDQSTYLYAIQNSQGETEILGAVDAETYEWIEYDNLVSQNHTIEGDPLFSSGAFYWSGGAFYWSGGAFYWSGGAFYWSGGAFYWSGNESWSAGFEAIDVPSLGEGNSEIFWAD